MKRITSLLLVIAFAGVILLPSSRERNSLLSNQSVIADGGGSGKPVPPMPPCVFSPASASLSS
jgi:hypothetical protein